MSHSNTKKVTCQVATLFLILVLIIATLIISIASPTTQKYKNWKKDTILALSITSINLILYYIIYIAFDFYKNKKSANNSKMQDKFIKEFEVIRVIKTMEEV
jgi:uncharacterized membrane protein